MKIKVQNAEAVYVEKYIDGNVAIIGRSQVCDVVVVDESLSRQHCKVELIDGDFFITDLNSSNGVYINETRIPPQTQIPFKSFDRIHLGSLELSANDIDLTRSHFVKAPVKETNLMLDAPTSVTRKLDVKRSTPKPFSQNKRNEPEKSPIPLAFILSALVFAGIFGVVIYKIFQPPENLTDQVVREPESKPKVRKFKPNVFLSQITYNEIKTRSSCRGELDMCAQLGISSESGEGFIVEDNSLFIFSRPELHAEEKIFQAIKNNPDRDLLISLYHLMRSTIMSLYYEEELDEVNLVFLTADGSIRTIYRIHQHGHSFKKISFSEAYQAIERAIYLNDSTIAWEAFKAPLPKLLLSP